MVKNDAKKSVKNGAKKMIKISDAKIIKLSSSYAITIPKYLLDSDVLRLGGKYDFFVPDANLVKTLSYCFGCKKELSVKEKSEFRAFCKVCRDKPDDVGDED